MVSVLFIGGLGRSGTTLLERLLGELPGVTPLGEVVHLWRRGVRHDERCACGRPFSRCPFWTAVGERAFGGWDDLDLPRLLALQSAVDRTRFIPRLAATSLPADWRAAVAEYVAYYERVYAAAAELSGARVVIDSSKNASLAYCLRWSTALDLKVLHLVRDARGVAYSWTKEVARPESDGADVMTRYSPTRSALLWDAHNAAFALLRRRGVAVRRLRYEKLVAAPGRTAASLARWLGVPAELGFLAADGAARLGPCHSAAGNPMRFTTGTVPLRRDDAWRTQLPPAQRRLVAAMTAPLLGRYGYPLATGRG